MQDYQLRMRHPNLTLHWASSDVWLASQGYDVWISTSEGKSWDLQGSVKTGLLPGLARHPLIAQVGRLGIHNLIQLSSGTIICVADRRLYRSTSQGKEFVSVFSTFQGRRPLRMGICQDHVGRIYFGEYLVNRDRKTVQLWRSEDDALSWYPVFTWPQGAIAHIHFVQFDPYEQSLWVGTGDEDHEIQLLRSHDGGMSFETVGGGCQLWRACSLLFTKEAIFWGTDIGFDHNNQPNYMMRLDRTKSNPEKIRQIGGPAYYSTQLDDGTLVVGTCVEKANQTNDTCLHVYWSHDHKEWNDIRLWPKLMAPNIVGPATITFPLRNKPLHHILFNTNLTPGKFNGALFELQV